LGWKAIESAIAWQAVDQDQYLCEWRESGEREGVALTGKRNLAQTDAGRA